MRKVIDRTILIAFLINLLAGPLALGRVEQAAAAALTTTETAMSAGDQQTDRSEQTGDNSGETDETTPDENGGTDVDGAGEPEPDEAVDPDESDPDAGTDEDANEAPDEDPDEDLDEDADAESDEDEDDAEETPMPDPDPPAKGDGYKKPSSKGINVLLLPLRAGFLTQPQGEQYVVEAEDLKVDLSVQTTGIYQGLFGSVMVKINKWEWNRAGNDGQGKWELQQLEVKPSGSVVTNKQSAKIVFGDNFESLSVGVYYFQMSVDYGALSSTRYSKLAKVVVLESERPAKDIAVTAESNVVLPDLDYEAKANLTPADSTSVVSWDSPSGGVTFAPDKGRHTEFTVANSLIASAVNRSTTTPGLPFDLLRASVSVNSETGESLLSDTASLCVGGLRAKEVPVAFATNNAVQWSIDGLSKYVNEFFDGEDLEEEAAIAADSTYEWKVSKADRKGKYSETKLGSSYKNVVHSSGDFKGTTPLSLNDSQILTIPANDQLLQDAKSELERGYPMYLRLQIEIKKGKNTYASSFTNNAEFRVIDGPTVEEPGQLTLQQVPMFDFASLRPTTIYNGTNGDPAQMPTATNMENRFLQVYDNRANTQRAAWQLSATLTDFTSLETGSGQAVQSVQRPQLILQGLPTINGSAPIIDAAQPLSTILTGDGTGTGGLYQVGAQLALPENGDVQLYDKQQFQATIDWTLTTGTPVAAALE
ncbi:hypothetical protein ACFQHW_11760 [Lapidilactobacillus achengensis]|uniref:WxL domain-containing protein n=1 Tax=Lapidilactobacillus achengensis TaxID=2486000 RepID=A0ABW1UQP7_9LACO|nr:hypothetical protein [Lapidilactobacillus achengensis]